MLSNNEKRYFEGILRNAKYTTCFTKDKKFTPIHDMSEEMMDSIYKKYNIELPYIYIYVHK